MKLGILGTGMIVQDLLPIMDKIELESVSILGTERSRARTEHLAEQYGLERCYFDYDEMLSSDADAIYIALPNNLHVPYARKALDAGKHVIAEKPAATSLTDFQELRRLSEEKGLILLEAMTVHYLPAYQSLKKELEKVGPVRMVNMNFSQYSSRYDKFLAGETPPVFDPNQAGGALMDVNVYNLHFTVGLFGKPKTARYYANVQRGVDTSGAAVLDYGGFKVVCIGAKDSQSPTPSVIQGEKGCVMIPMPVNRMTAYAVAGNQADAETREFPQVHRMLSEFQEFRRVIEELSFRTVDKRQFHNKSRNKRDSGKRVSAVSF